MHTQVLAHARWAPALPPTLVTTIRTATTLLDQWLAPIVQLAIRFWMAQVFFLSGLTKINDWPSTLFLFELEYQVPLLPPAVAAYMGTAFELAMPVLLVVGLMTRLAALPLLGMAMVIQFALGANNPAYDHIEHYYWMLLLLTIIARGAGPLSLDYILARIFGVRS